MIMYPNMKIGQNMTTSKTKNLLPNIHSIIKYFPKKKKNIKSTSLPRMILSWE